MSSQNLPSHTLTVKGADKKSFRTTVGCLFPIEKGGELLGYRVVINPGIALLSGSDVTAWPHQGKDQDAPQE